MSKKLKKKAAIMFVVEIICIVVLGIFLTVLQTDLSIESQYKDTKEKIQQMQGLLDNADEAAAQNTVSYDEVYKSKADSVAYMAGNVDDFQRTDQGMRELADMMNVTDRKSVV